MTEKNPCERTHAELEQYHYRAIRENPSYRQDFRLDVLREEISWNMPRIPEVKVEEIEQYEPPWTSKQWDEIKQIKGLALFLQRKLNEHLDAGKRRVANRVPKYD